MFLKKGNRLLIAFVFLLLGAIISYITCQYSFFDIITEFNVVDLFLRVTTVVIGFYIATTLKNNRNQNQNLYIYFEGKYDALWKDFIQFSEVLELSEQIELSESSKWFKKITQKITPLTKTFKSFNQNIEWLEKIEEKIDALESFISDNNNIKNDILNLKSDKENFTSQLNEINELFAVSFKNLIINPVIRKSKKYSEHFKI